MDSYLNKELFRQDLQDFQDCFYLSHFPDGNEKRNRLRRIKYKFNSANIFKLPLVITTIG